MKMQSIVIVLTILNTIKIIDSDSKHNDHDLFCLGEAPRGYVRICGWGNCNQGFQMCEQCWSCSKVSPNWSQKTITCHTPNCFSIVGGQGNAPLMPSLPSSCYMQMCTWGMRGYSYGRSDCTSVNSNWTLNNSADWQLLSAIVHN